MDASMKATTTHATQLRRALQPKTEQAAQYLHQDAPESNDSESGDDGEPDGDIDSGPADL